MKADSVSTIAETAERTFRKNYMTETSTETVKNEAAAQAPAYLDKFAMAEMLRITPRTLDIWMRDKRVPYIKIARTVRFDVEIVREYLRKGMK